MKFYFYFYTQRIWTSNEKYNHANIRILEKILIRSDISKWWLCNLVFLSISKKRKMVKFGTGSRILRCTNTNRNRILRCTNTNRILPPSIPSSPFFQYESYGVPIRVEIESYGAPIRVEYSFFPENSSFLSLIQPSEPIGENGIKYNCRLFLTMYFDVKWACFGGSIFWHFLISLIVFEIFYGKIFGNWALWLLIIFSLVSVFVDGNKSSKYCTKVWFYFSIVFRRNCRCISII